MIKALLAPLTLPYYLGYLAHRALVKPKKFPCPVVSVGNITWGGSGKTPTVIKLAEEFLAEGRKVAILTRGYKRKREVGSGEWEVEGGKWEVGSGRWKVEGEKGKVFGGVKKEPLIVSDGKDILSSVEDAGDEPYLMAEKIKKAIILVGADRAVSAGVAIDDYNADVLLLDDGFQRWGISRDLDIVCVNASNPFGNGLLIPAGILREPLAALGRAGLIALTNIDKISDEKARELKEKISSVSSAPIITAKHSAVGIKNVFTDSGENIGKSREVVGFSGIGNNKGFEDTLRSLGRNVKRFYPFADHKWYAESEILNMLSANPAALFVTTLKDAVRFRNFRTLPRERFFYVDVKLEIVEGESAWRQILKPLF
ncbi:MAG: tetraacyldisaccharide 4'-kinase [Endomicrobiia bacterium]|nr:tetraacyldisaccharide 4'-kinase [Endomicrobiia bacterium]